MSARTLNMGDASEAGIDGDTATFVHAGAAATDVEVHVFRQDDGATVVMVDTHGDDRLRIRINDNPIFDQGVESGTDYLEPD